MVTEVSEGVAGRLCSATPVVVVAQPKGISSWAMTRATAEVKAGRKLAEREAPILQPGGVDTEVLVMAVVEQAVTSLHASETAREAVPAAQLRKARR